MANVEQEVMKWMIGKLRNGISDPLGYSNRAWIIVSGARNVVGYPRITLEEVTIRESSPYIGRRGENNTYIKQHIINYQIDIYVEAGRNPDEYIYDASDGKLKAILSDQVDSILKENECGEEEIDDDGNIDVVWIDDITRRNRDELDISESSKSENVPPFFIKTIDFNVIVDERRSIT
jgi:hypothetical protein